MARKPFVADKAMRDKVRHLSGVGVRQDEIALMIGCSPKTLRKRFRDELDLGVAEANATIGGYLFAAAKSGNVAAQIFWLKTRAHWRERTAADAKAADAQEPLADADATSQVLLVLPDNGRDHELTQVLRNAQEDYFAQKPRGSAAAKSAFTAWASDEGGAAPNQGDSFPPAARNLIPGEGGQNASAPGG
jgi:hypothetical protein